LSDEKSLVILVIRPAGDWWLIACTCNSQKLEDLTPENAKNNNASNFYSSFLQDEKWGGGKLCPL